MGSKDDSKWEKGVASWFPVIGLLPFGKIAKIFASY